ncbi:MAG: hypothetical protein RL154_977 [Pseudomonadota bacterium]|jgi:2-keto-4-pentenoate hydratase/2-oxohepta-3-ene-1,7-dioic acid hydratase in catechol pathway
MKRIKFKNLDICPSKIICVGRNYVEHIKELGNEMPDELVIFNKPNSAISDELKFFSQDTRFEGEICFLIMQNKIAGIGFGLDLTKADIQNKLKTKGLPWERAKGFDDSAVFGEFVPFNSSCNNLHFEMFINGLLAQKAGYELMIHKPEDILKEIQTFMSVEDGDIIMSGTPKGVATYKQNDKFSAKVYDDKKELLAFEKIVMSCKIIK